MARNTVLQPPATMRLTQSNRSKSKCENCIEAITKRCDIFIPSICNNYCPPLGYLNCIQFDDELNRIGHRK